MESASLHRLGALGGIVCGSAILIGGTIELINGDKTSVSTLLNGLAVPFGLALLVGLYLHIRPQAGRFGGIAFAVNFIAFGLFGGIAYAKNFVLTHLDRATLREVVTGQPLAIFQLTGVLALVGSLLFGLALLRVPGVPKPAAVGYLVGLATLSLTSVLPAPVVRIGHIVAGLAMLWLAYHLWNAVRGPASRLQIPTTASQGAGV